MWNFGSLAGLSLAIMIVTGIVLAMSYTAHVDYAFSSVERIMRDVNHGWMIRYIHMNTANFSSLLYTSTVQGFTMDHISATRTTMDTWGCNILIDDGDSLYGICVALGANELLRTTVITNLFSAIPYVGESIVTLL